MLLSVDLRDILDVLDDALHEVLGVGLSLLLILGDLADNLLSGSLGSQSLGSLLLVGLVLGGGLLLPDGFGGVKLVHEVSVLQGVLLLDVMGDHVPLGGAEDGLDLVRVDDSGEVTVSHAGTMELIALLLEGGLALAAEEGIKLGEGTLSPDDHTAELSSGGELE